MVPLLHAWSVKLKFDYIPASNLPKIEAFLHESKEGKGIKTSEYIGRPTYGKGRADVIII